MIIISLAIFIIFYAICSAIIDIALLLSSSNNGKMMLGATGMLFNMFIINISQQMRPLLSNDKLFYLALIISIVNIIASAIQIIIGMKSYE